MVRENVQENLSQKIPEKNTAEYERWIIRLRAKKQRFLRRKRRNREPRISSKELISSVTENDLKFENDLKKRRERIEKVKAELPEWNLSDEEWDTLIEVISMILEEEE